MPPIHGYTGYLILIQHNIPYVQKGDHVTNYWKRHINLLHTVPLKSKLIVTRDLILDSQTFRGSSLESQESSIEFQWSNFESRNTMNLSCTHSKNCVPLRESRLLLSKWSSQFESENARVWSPVNSPFETCFLEAKANIITCTLDTVIVVKIEPLFESKQQLNDSVDNRTQSKLFNRESS